MVTLGIVLALIGLSFREAPLSHIARLSDAPSLVDVVDALTSGADPALRGAVVLSTCNRFELYLDAVRFHDSIDAIVAWVSTSLDVSPEVAAQELSVCMGSAAATHLFRVAAGLDSVVVGEAEISGQVASAFQRALADSTTSPALNVLFPAAARVAKRVATETGLGAAGRSIASVALDMVEPRVGKMSAASVLLVGTGSYVRVVAATLKARHCADVSVFSSSGRQREFASDRGLIAVDPTGLSETLRRVDLVVTCSGTGAVVLEAPLMREVLADRGRPLQVVDLAVRPDVPEETRRLRGIDVIGLRDITKTEGAASDLVSDTVAGAELMIAAAVDEFAEEVAARRLDPAVVALRQHVTDTIDREMARLQSRLPREAADEVQRSLHRIAHSLLHTPTIRAHELARDGQGARYVDALHTLFGIDTPGFDER